LRGAGQSRQWPCGVTPAWPLSCVGRASEERPASCGLESERQSPGWYSRHAVAQSNGQRRFRTLPDDHQLWDLRPTGVLRWQKQTIWKANGTWAASMAVRPACRSLRIEAQRSRALFATSGGRNSLRTRRGRNTSAGKIGATIRLAIRNSDSLSTTCNRASDCVCSWLWAMGNSYRRYRRTSGRS
jgi:outer membrane translocation and assembly module TamA